MTNSVVLLNNWEETNRSAWLKKLHKEYSIDFSTATHTVTQMMRTACEAIDFGRNFLVNMEKSTWAHYARMVLWSRVLREALGGGHSNKK